MVAGPGHTVSPGLWPLQHETALHSLQHFQGLGACQSQGPLHKLGVSIRNLGGIKGAGLHSGLSSGLQGNLTFSRERKSWPPMEWGPSLINSFIWEVCLCWVSQQWGKQPGCLGWRAGGGLRGHLVTYVRYWLTFSAGCLKRPSNSSLAHYRQSKQITGGNGGQNGLLEVLETPSVNKSNGKNIAALGEGKPPKPTHSSTPGQWLHLWMCEKKIKICIPYFKYFMPQ